MTWILAFRTLMSRPVRTAVLIAGFGLGVAVTAALLGVAAVILEQARAPELVGGGDVIIDGATGRLPNAKLLLSMLKNDAELAPRVSAVAPIERTTLYLMDLNGRSTPVRARGGVPSLDRDMKDPETTTASGWVNATGDEAWAEPGLKQVLREMDSFRSIPAVERWADSWAEWLYFNGRSPNAGFYLSMIAGPQLPSGNRRVSVRLQLEESGRTTNYSDVIEVEAIALYAAPDLTLGNNRVRLEGFDYHIHLDLPDESGDGHVSGDLILSATPGRFLPPLTLRGAGGWLSGYVVPVMAGSWRGSIVEGTRTIGFDGAAGYHDHNWGFWEGVTWQWGQVQANGLSFVYGRIRPPAEAANPDRVPPFLMALGPDGPIGYSTDVNITEVDRTDERAPSQIVIRGGNGKFDVTIEIESISSTVRSRFSRNETDIEFLQMRGEARVSGAIGGEQFAFTAPASAETFR